jgi:hypothetical protein
MPDQTNRTKPRPVDALFGEGDAPALPNYVVEPAQPVTTASAPPPDLKQAESQPTSDRPTDEAFGATLSSSDEPIVYTPEPIEIGEPFKSNNSVLEPVSVIRDSKPSVYASEALLSPTRGSNTLRFDQLSERIDRLYGDVKMDFHDSKAVTEFCFQLLMQGRQAIEDGDYARAEYFVQSVDAKLKRSQKSAKAARGIGVIAIWLWQFIGLGIGATLLALTYVINLTLFGLPVVADLHVLLRAIGWGMIGGVIGALYNLPWFIQYREYDPSFNMNYFARPIIGGLLGAVMYLISQTGILAGSLVVGDVKVGPIFLYFFALLAGFKQEYVGEFSDNLVRAIFRGPQPPSGLKPPKAHI